MTAFASHPPPSTPSWDIFCQVIDNFGDVGVCWRLAAELGARGINVQLRIDDASALAWMAPHGAPNVRVLPYDAPYGAGTNTHPAVVIEAFGCEAPAPYLAALNAHHTQCKARLEPAPVLVNLEYLSAEAYVERCHRLPSLIMSGAAAGMTRWFFYPGFTAQTGGLLREQSLDQRRAQFDRLAWRQAHATGSADCAISLFCYEPAALPQWLTHWSACAPEVAPRLFVTPGRATAAVQHHLLQSTTASDLQPVYLQPCSQTAFDELLWACDLNLVRGEDSLVRALWAGQPFVWHIYPQHDNAHHAKLNAFLDWLQAPESLRAFHHAWNGITPPSSLPTITPLLLQEWRDCALRAQHNLRQQADLITQLQQFVAEKS